MMEFKLKELTDESAIRKTYEIYKHCMFMPTPEKFGRKIAQFLNDSSVKIFVCFNREKIAGVMVVSFTEPHGITILGIAVEPSERNKHIASYMIDKVTDDYGLRFVYAETDNDAVGFYRKYGFGITKFTETYDGETVVRYRCEFSKTGCAHPH